VNDIAAQGRGRAPTREDESRPGNGQLAARDAAAHDTAARDAAADLFTAISVIRRTARRAARNAWARQPLPPAQSELLRLAAARPGLTVADAATELRLAPNTVSTLVGRLTDAGLLNRERSAQDGRTALLTTTDQANQRLTEFRDLRSELAGRALAQLQEADRRALAAAVPALLRLAEQIEQIEQIENPARPMESLAERIESL
jgi:DNA-binding MarR family transcriptional regulator